MPQVSVVVPVFKVEAFLEEAVHSILEQKGVALELVLVCDPSPDASTAIAERLALADRRIVLIRNPERRGLPSSLNIGIDAATAPFIARHDSDDIALPGRLAAQYAYMERNPDIGLLGSSAFIIDAGGTLTGGSFNALTNPASLAWGMHFQNMLLHPAMFFRGEVLRGARYAEDTLLAEDYELWTRLSQTHWISNLAPAHMLYRQHDNNGSQVYADPQSVWARNIAARGVGALIGRTVDPYDVVRISGWLAMQDRARPATPLSAAEFERLGGILTEMLEHFLLRLAARPSNVNAVYGDFHMRLKRLADGTAGPRAPIYERVDALGARATAAVGRYEEGIGG